MESYKKMHNLGIMQAGEPSDQGRSRLKSIMVVEEELMVGFEDEAMAMKEQLISEGKKQLEIISIVGMPGLGKTTLARNVYEDPYIMHLFHIRAWTYVSQAYVKRELLIDILHSIVKTPDKVNQMSNEKIGEQIYKRLKGKRYLIVMDDMWSTGAWDDVKLYLPNDKNGSRVMFTSRLTEVGLHAKPECRPHRLRFLTEEESWELLHKKVFGDKTFPPELIGLGKQIAKKCEGLPLAIVVIAGFLAKEQKTKALWKQVAESVSSCIAGDQNQYLHTLELSYKHLPHHLKQCFLYFGTFLEDRDIPVRKLIWLWIAERFIQPTGEENLEDIADEDYLSTDLNEEKELEDIAEEYLTDLIERSLVMVVQKRSNGGIKACRMHDLLRNLCLRKAEEFNFTTWIRESDHISFSSNNGGNNPHRLSIHPDSNFDLDSIKPYARSVKSIFWFGKLDPYGSSGFYASSSSSVRPIPALSNSLLDTSCDYLMSHSGRRPDLLHQRLSFLESLNNPSMQLSVLRNKFPFSFNRQKTFKPLRVLDLWCLDIFFSFSFEISELLYLKFLAIHTDTIHTIPPSIINLSNLETLILGTRRSHIILPENVWKMVKLRHLYTRGKFHIESQCLVKALVNCDWSPHILHNLQTISNLCPCGRVPRFLLRTPNLRKLGLHGYLISESGHLTVPNLDSLGHLETLKLDNTMLTWSTNLLSVVFPTNVKKVTLRGMRIKWEEMWILGMLHNLEVLKLERRACQGPQWETTDGGFRRLKFLKLKCLGIQQWVASSTHFPRLQHLVLEDCFSLKEIPSGFGDIPVLQIIEVTFCLPSAEESARQIKRRQERNGNNWLKILINNQECCGMTCDSSIETESTGSESEQ